MPGAASRGLAWAGFEALAGHTGPVLNIATHVRGEMVATWLGLGLGFGLGLGLGLELGVGLGLGLGLGLG